MAGRIFPADGHMPLDGAAAAIEQTTAGELRQNHFFAHPGRSSAVLQRGVLLRGPSCRSLTDLLSVEELREMLRGGYLLHPTEGSAETLKQALDRLWAQEDDPQLLARVRQLIEQLYPRESSLTASSSTGCRRAALDRLHPRAHGRRYAGPRAPDGLSRQVPDVDGRMIRPVRTTSSTG